MIGVIDFNKGVPGKGVCRGCVHMRMQRVCGVCLIKRNGRMSMMKKTPMLLLSLLLLGVLEYVVIMLSSRQWLVAPSPPQQVEFIQHLNSRRMHDINPKHGRRQPSSSEEKDILENIGKRFIKKIFDQDSSPASHSSSDPVTASPSISPSPDPPPFLPYLNDLQINEVETYKLLNLSSNQVEIVFKSLIERIKGLMVDKEKGIGFGEGGSSIRGHNEGYKNKKEAEESESIQFWDYSNDRRYNTSPEVLVENDDSLLNRVLTHDEEMGNNIMLTLRTIKKSHKKRLPLLFDTWVSKVNKSNLFIMTDDVDPDLQRQASKEGMHYVLSSCSSSYINREDRLCCRTGIEFAQIFERGNEFYDWQCHIDDDMYVSIPPLVQLLSGKFNPRKDAVYFGRSGSDWYSPRTVRSDAKLGKEGESYHFAVGGMYCLSRAMLELARPYMVGEDDLTQTCEQTKEPDDVTIGFIVGILLNKTLSRTEKIYTHGLHLMSTVDPYTLSQQIAFSYGFGSTPWGDSNYNAIDVPDPLYSIEEDESQFRSLHCHLWPSEQQCVDRLNQVINSQLRELSY